MRKLLAAMTLLAGCATVQPTPSGPVVSSVSQELRICLDRGSLRGGQEVHFSRTVCKRTLPKTPLLSCIAQSTGTGEVIRLLEDGCALVRLPADSLVQPGDEAQ